MRTTWSTSETGRPAVPSVSVMAAAKPVSATGVSSMPLKLPGPTAIAGVSASAATTTVCVALRVAVEPSLSVVVTLIDSVASPSSSSGGVTRKVSSVERMSAAGPVMVQTPPAGTTFAVPCAV
jgi:hypothetical protein